MSSNLHPPEYEPLRPHSSPIPQRDALQDPPPYRSSSSYSDGSTDSSSSSGYSNPFAYNHQLASPDAPTDSDSYGSAPDSDDSMRSSGRDGNSRSSSSGDSLPFPFHDDITQPLPPPPPETTTFSHVVEDGATTMEPVLSNATDMSDITAPLLTPAPSQPTTSQPLSRQSTKPPDQPDDRPKWQFPRSRSATHSYTAFAHTRTTSAYSIDDLEHAGGTEATPQTSVTAERPIGLPDGVDADELWIDPFVYRAITGRSYSSELPFAQADRDVVSTWIQRRLDKTRAMGGRWSMKVPSIWLDPDERSAPLARPIDGLVILHVALHRVRNGDDGWDGGPEVHTKDRHERLAVGESELDFHARMLRDPPPYLRLFPCFCTMPKSALRRASDWYPANTRVELIDYAECPHRQTTTPSRERQKSGSAPIAPHVGRSRSLSRSGGPILAASGWLPTQPATPSGEVMRSTRRVTITAEPALPMTESGLVNAFFPIIDEQIWGVVRPVAISNPRPLTPIPAPVSARPLEPALMPRLVLSPTGVATERYLVQALFPDPSVRDSRQAAEIIRRWSPDLPHVPTLGPSLISMTRPGDVPARPLFIRAPLPPRPTQAELERLMPAQIIRPRPAARPAGPLFTRTPLLRPSIQPPTDDELTRFMTSPIVQDHLARNGLQYDVRDDGEEGGRREHRWIWRRPNEGSSTGSGGCQVQ